MQSLHKSTSTPSTLAGCKLASLPQSSQGGMGKRRRCGVKKVSFWKTSKWREGKEKVLKIVLNDEVMDKKIVIYFFLTLMLMINFR